MLDAGVDLFHDLSLADVLAGLNVSKVARRARVTRPTFYAHWPTQADYVQELVGHVLDPSRLTLSDEVVTALTSIATRNEGTVDALRTILHHDIELLRSDADFRFELVTWSKSDDPRVSEHLSGFYRAIDDDLVAAYELLLQRWGRQPRPPLTLRKLAALLDSLVVGLAQRRMVDPDLATPELYADIVLLLLPQVTRQIGDDRQIDDLVAEVERFHVVPGAGASGAPAVPGRARPSTREIILAASERLTSDRGWAELPLDDVATAAGTTTDEIVAVFGSRAGLGSAQLERRILAAVPPVQPVPPVPPAGDAPLDGLRAALASIRRVCTTRRGLSLAAVGVAVGYMPGDDLTNAASAVVARVAGYVGEAQGAGALPPDPPAPTVAASLVSTLLTDVAVGGTPGLEPEQLVLDALSR